MLIIRPTLYATFGADQAKRFIKTASRFNYRGDTHAEWQQVEQIFGWFWRTRGAPFRDRTALFMEVR